MASAIDKFYTENERSVNQLIEGSDEHLDLILSITKPLLEIAEKFKSLNEYLYTSLRNVTDETLRNEIVPKLRDVNKSCATLVGTIRTSWLYRDVRTALKEYTRQYDFFREIFHDTIHFRLHDNTDLDNVLKELNDL